MKNIIVGFVVCLLLSGCAAKPQWDKAGIEKDVQAQTTKELQKTRPALQCTSVKLVPDGDNKFTGYGEISDGSQRNITVTVNPANGEYIIEWS